MNSLNNKKGNDPGYLWSGLKTSTSCVARKIKTISLGVPFFFQYFAFLLPICLLCVSCGTYHCKEDKCCVVTHRAADIQVAWLVYVRTYCVPIATLNQNKPS